MDLFILYVVKDKQGCSEGEYWTHGMAYQRGDSHGLVSTSISFSNDSKSIVFIWMAVASITLDLIRKA